MAAPLWREALAGLALLFAVFALADDSLHARVRHELRDDNYVLIENRQDSNSVRLFVFLGHGPDVNAQLQLLTTQNDYDTALEMTRSADSRERVRGLTFLSAIDDPLVLDAALILPLDPDAAVREEAYQLVLDHPDSDVDGIRALALNHSSARVRQAVADLIAEQSGD